MELDTGLVLALHAYENETEEDRERLREQRKQRKQRKQQRKQQRKREQQREQQPEQHREQQVKEINYTRRREPTAEERRANRELRSFFTKNGHMIG